MKRNIEALWTGTPITVDMSEEDQAIFSKKSRELRKAYATLEENIDAEQAALLQKYMDLQSTVNDFERKNAFVSGFSLGVRLIIEAVDE